MHDFGYCYDRADISLCVRPKMGTNVVIQRMADK